MIGTDVIPQDAPALVNTRRLATWLGVTPWTVRRWVLAGILPPPIRLGAHTTRHSVAAVRAAICAKAEGGPEEGD